MGFYNWGKKSETNFFLAPLIRRQWESVGPACHYTTTGGRGDWEVLQSLGKMDNY
jgi:hypothetical protein